MHILLRSLVIALTLTATVLLAGCESSEEKAERYFKSGMELLAAGDEERALVEFRNVFKYNGFHKDARKTYADIQFKRGEVAEAYSQYLRLIEQYPDTVDVRQILAETAIARGDWAEAERHGKAAIALTPDAPGVQAIGAALDYRDALINRNTAAQAESVKKARAILQELPDNQTARRIVINDLVANPDPTAALPEVELALEVEPKSLELHVLKLRLLTKANDMPAVGAQLKTMVERFPDSQEVRAALISWYMNQKDFDGAEAYLRELAGEDTAAPEGHVSVIQLLQSARGNDAAMAELDRLIAANTGNPNADLYGTLRASMRFAAGERDEAIATVEGILAKAEPSDGTRRIKATLAQMLLATGNQVGARARVEEILAEDASQTDALKMRAGFLINEDKPGEAIVDLRTALSQNPRDAGTLTLMAEAYERDGSLDLAGERLALAVEVSNKAPAESLRYARFLLRQDRATVAEAVLVDARKTSPTHVGILSQLANIWLRAKDWPRAQGIADTLAKIDTDEARNAARSLQAALLQGQDRTEDSLAFLEAQLGKGGNDISAIAQIVQTQVRAGKSDEARTFLDEEIAKKPDDGSLQMLSAGLYAVMGQAAEAEAAFRKVIADNPQAENPVRLLYGLLISGGRKDEAEALLKTTLEAQPRSTTLRWMLAGQYEQAGDFDKAIEVYEALYAEDTSNVVVANNLASMITSHRDDAESLERAATVARRLRGTEVPAFQDTYGWIEYRRGNLTDALTYLEPAAAGLPNDPLTQFHLGMTYAGLGQVEKAREALNRALEVAGDRPLPQMEEARKALAELP